MRDAAPPALVVMGVSGSGKSHIGAALAAALGAQFLDADDLHPEANLRKMAAGVPLDDHDRMPWLDAVAAWIGAGRAGGGVDSRPHANSQAQAAQGQARPPRSPPRSWGTCGGSPRRGGIGYGSAAGRGAVTA